MLKLLNVPVENKMSQQWIFGPIFSVLLISLFSSRALFYLFLAFPCSVPLCTVVSLSFFFHFLWFTPFLGGYHWNSILRLIIMSSSCTVIAVSGWQAQQATILPLTKEQICCMLINFGAGWGCGAQMRMWLSLRRAPFLTSKTELLTIH